MIVQKEKLGGFVVVTTEPRTSPVQTFTLLCQYQSQSVQKLCTTDPFLKKTKTSVTLSLWDPLLRTERKSMKSPNVIPPADTLMLHHKPALSVSSSWWDPIFLSSNTSTYDEGKKAEIPIQTSGNLCCLYRWIWRQGAHIWPTLQAGRETDKPGRETQINIRLFFLINLVS